MKSFIQLFYAVILMSIMSCNNSRAKEFDLQGHRGCRGLMPENTIPAMLRALDLKVNTLEMDVVISKDSQVIVSHEPFFNHEISTLPSGDTLVKGCEQLYNIFNMPYDSVAQFDVGTRPHPRFPLQQKMKAVKPLLAELIDSAEAYTQRKGYPKTRYNIEIKSTAATDNVFHPVPGVYAGLLMQVLGSKGIENRVTIQSFDPRSLFYVSKHFPEMQLALLIENQKIPTGNFEKVYGFVPRIISPDYTLLTKEIIKDLHQQNIKVIPWTVNDINDAKKLYEWGVDGMITDYPDRVNLPLLKQNNSGQ